MPCSYSIVWPPTRPPGSAGCSSRLLDRSGCSYRYLPAYSPDFNPLEMAWAKVKTDLRRVAARTADALHQALGPALDSITAEDASGFFRHAGYSRPK